MSVWLLIFVNATQLPLADPVHVASAQAPMAVGVGGAFDGFTSKERCEAALKWFRENMRRAGVCLEK